MGGRRTATTGLATAATYVGQRLAGYGLQPIHPGEYRHLTYGPINHVRGIVIRSMLRDSTSWGADPLMVPDPRSMGIRTRLASFRRLSAERPVVPAERDGQAAVLDWIPSDSLARAIGQAGYRVIFALGIPGAGRSSTRLPVAIVHVAPVRWERISGASAASREGPLPVRVTIEADFEPTAGYLHVMGILPGSRPVMRDRLVVLAAPLDSGANPAGQPILDPGGSGIAAAALLEAARVLASEADGGSGLPHSVLFVWLSGSAQDNAGLRAFLKAPPWAKDAIDAVVYAGPDSVADLPGVRRLGPDTSLSSPSPNPVAVLGQALAAGYHQAAQQR